MGLREKDLNYKNTKVRVRREDCWLPQGEDKGVKHDFRDLGGKKMQDSAMLSCTKK